MTPLSLILLVQPSLALLACRTTPFLPITRGKEYVTDAENSCLHKSTPTKSCCFLAKQTAMGENPTRRRKGGIHGTKQVHWNQKHATPCMKKTEEQNDFLTFQSAKNHDNFIQERSPEYFSVAPMMSHTNRHFRFFFRLMSERAHLYTEMIPAATVETAVKRILSHFSKLDNLDSIKKDSLNFTNVVQCLVDCREQDIKSMVKNKDEEIARNSKLNSPPETLSSVLFAELDQLLAYSPIEQSQPPTLQLGGRDPSSLALATAVAVALYHYQTINLNCGCPSVGVSGGSRKSGVALMKDPLHVLRCVDAMHRAALQAHEMRTHDGKAHFQKPEITVKHRLGAVDAAVYNRTQDVADGDGPWMESLEKFLSVITSTGAVSRVQIHARVGLLGEVPLSPPATSENSEKTETTSGASGTEKSSPQGLWVPGREASTASTSVDKNKKLHVNHQREQQKALKLARASTVANRSVPPLRYGVAKAMAERIPSLQVVLNGGLHSLHDVECLLDSDNPVRGASLQNGSLLGGMVGRAVINHPCAFSNADELWNKRKSTGKTSTPEKPQISKKRTRGQVLQAYMSYCDKEEARLTTLVHDAAAFETRPSSALAALTQEHQGLRKQLVSAPFHLFYGEEGNDGYQRCLRKLVNRKSSAKLQAYGSASAMLRAAASFVPRGTLDKPVTRFVPLKDVPVFDFVRRSGPMQRQIW